LAALVSLSANTAERTVAHDDDALTGGTVGVTAHGCPFARIASGGHSITLRSGAQPESAQHLLGAPASPCTSSSLDPLKEHPFRYFGNTAGHDSCSGSALRAIAGSPQAEQDDRDEVSRLRVDKAAEATAMGAISPLRPVGKPLTSELFMPLSMTPSSFVGPLVIDPCSPLSKDAVSSLRESERATQLSRPMHIDSAQRGNYRERSIPASARSLRLHSSCGRDHDPDFVFLDSEDSSCSSESDDCNHSSEDDANASAGNWTHSPQRTRRGRPPTKRGKKQTHQKRGRSRSKSSTRRRPAKSAQTSSPMSPFGRDRPSVGAASRRTRNAADAQSAHTCEHCHHSRAQKRAHDVEAGEESGFSKRARQGTDSTAPRQLGDEPRMHPASSTMAQAPRLQPPFAATSIDATANPNQKLVLCYVPCWLPWTAVSLPPQASPVERASVGAAAAADHRQTVLHDGVPAPIPATSVAVGALTNSAKQWEFDHRAWSGDQDEPEVHIPRTANGPGTPQRRHRAGNRSPAELHRASGEPPDETVVVPHSSPAAAQEEASSVSVGPVASMPAIPFSGGDAACHVIGLGSQAHTQGTPPLRTLSNAAVEAAARIAATSRQQASDTSTPSRKRGRPSKRKQSVLTTHLQRLQWMHDEFLVPLQEENLTGQESEGASRAGLRARRVRAISPVGRRVSRGVLGLVLCVWVREPRWLK